VLDPQSLLCHLVCVVWLARSACGRQPGGKRTEAAKAARGVGLSERRRIRAPARVAGKRPWRRVLPADAEEWSAATSYSVNSSTFLIACMACAIVLPSLMGCGGDSTSAAVIEFWAMGREGEVVRELMPEFEQRNEGVRVRVQQIPWTAAHEKLLTAYAGGSMPDVFQLGNTWISEFVALRAVESLDDRIAASSLVAPEDYFPGILAANMIEGITYGVPWYVDTRVVFYRMDVLEGAGYAEPPRTWDAWIDAMTRIKNSQGKEKYAILLPIAEWEVPVILALQLDADLLRDGDQHGNFRSAPFRKAFAFYLDLFRRGLAPPVGEAQVANVYQEFARAYFSMYVSGPWNIGEFRRRLPPKIEHSWATAPMPGPAENRPGVSIAGGASLAIGRASGRKEAAWKLIEYLSEPAQQGAFYRLTGDLPSRKAAWLREGLASDRRARAFWTQLEFVKPTPRIPEWEQIASKIAHYAEQAVRRSMTADAALTALDRDVDGLLEKRRWLLQDRRQHVGARQGRSGAADER